MTPTIACPERSDLLALAAGDAHSPALKAHVDACRACRKTVRRLEAEIGHLRSHVSSPSRLASTTARRRRTALDDA